MQLWLQWWRVVQQLRPACSRSRTFLWMSASLAAMTARGDLFGITSLVRALGLKKACYERILGFFHSTALDLDKLTQLWVTVIQNVQPGILQINGRRVIVGDGIKVPKSGKKIATYFVPSGPDSFRLNPISESYSANLCSYFIAVTITRAIRT